MDAVFAPEKVTFVEVPRPTGISNFLIELPTGEPIGWLAYHRDSDKWSVHLCPPGKFILKKDHFRCREDAERWVRSIVNRGFD